MIEFVEVTKSFGKITALSGVSFKMDKGVVAIVGLNGAGKTTLIRLILGLLKPTSGRVSVNGLDPASERDRLVGKIAYVPEKTAIYEKMTAKEYLRFFVALRNINISVSEILTDYGLEERSDDPISTLSKGMKRRLELARVLMGNPEILILDEPFSGIDPESRIRIRETIRNSGSKLIVVSSHDLREVERVADSVVVMKNGRVVFHGDIEKLMASNVSLTIRGVFDEGVKDLLRKFGAEIMGIKGNSISLRIARDHMPMLMRELSSSYDLFDVTSDGIENAFVELLKSG